TAVTAGNRGDAEAAPALLEAELAAAETEPDAPAPGPVVVYGDAAYGTGELLDRLAIAGATIRVKVQPSSAQAGRFSKDDFRVDLLARTVTCPAGRVAPFRGVVQTYAEFGQACRTCPLVARCTTSPRGRTIA